MLDSLGKALDSIVGPGSEWFWAAAQFLVVVISLAGIYSQLRAQASANGFHQMATLHERWDTDRLMRARLTLVLELRHGTGQYTAISPLTRPVADFFDDLAMLQQRGHLSLKHVWEEWNRTTEFWWILLAPTIRQMRVLFPGDYEPFERLEGLMRKLDRSAGQTNEFDPVTVSRVLDDLIVSLTARLRLEQESKAGSIPTAPNPP